MFRDFYGQLTKSVSEVIYMFVVIDNFSKYVRIYKLKKAATDAILKKVNITSTPLESQNTSIQTTERSSPRRNGNVN